MTEESVENALARLNSSRLSNFDIGELFNRNPTVHKWKAPFRSLLLREAVFWRFEDLLTQSYALHKLGHSLGARILLRSALETLAQLIRVNQYMARVVSGDLSFAEFSDKTVLLLLGSKNKSTSYDAVNISTTLTHCAKRYDWIEKLYADLSECAHPNHEGICMGYVKHDGEKFIESFSNRWAAIYSEGHEQLMTLCIFVFEHEYNNVWEENFTKLEKWIEANDSKLEATKNRPDG